MPFTVNKSQQFSHPPSVVYEAAKGAIEGLEGKLQDESSASDMKLVAKFHKTILGKVLGDRAWMQVAISAEDDGSSRLDLTAYPLDAVGRKLMFGARKGALSTLLSWFDAHLN
ncbi:MAG: hypothetical protein AAGD96_25610, partial [Chloroflexota bacterium]